MKFNLFDGGDVLAARPAPLVEVEFCGTLGALRGFLALHADPR